MLYEQWVIIIAYVAREICLASVAVRDAPNKHTLARVPIISSYTHAGTDVEIWQKSAAPVTPSSSCHHDHRVLVRLSRLRLGHVRYTMAAPAEWSGAQCAYLQGDYRFWFWSHCRGKTRRRRNGLHAADVFVYFTFWCRRMYFVSCEYYKILRTASVAVSHLRKPSQETTKPPNTFAWHCDRTENSSTIDVQWVPNVIEQYKHWIQNCYPANRIIYYFIAFVSRSSQLYKYGDMIFQ